MKGKGHCPNCSGTGKAKSVWHCDGEGKESEYECHFDPDAPRE